MSLDPVLFDIPQFETANESVLFCYEKMREFDMKSEMNRIRGMLPINKPSLARAVLRELLLMRPTIKLRVVATYMDVAIGALQHALSQPVFLAAS